MPRTVAGLRWPLWRRSSASRRCCNGPSPRSRSTRSSFLIAAHAHPGLDVGAQLARLDDLAATVPDAHARRRARTSVSRSEGFHGNDADYYDPENSMLDSVLDRRMGIPITLVGAADRGGPPPRGRLRRRLGARALHRPRRGRRHVLRPLRRRPVRSTSRIGCVATALAPLDPVGTYAIVARMLANLKGIYAQRGDADSLRWVMRLRVLVPGVPAAERRELARLMAPSTRDELGPPTDRYDAGMTTVAEAPTIDSEEARVNEAIDKLLDRVPAGEDRCRHVPRRSVRPRSRVGALR